MKLEFSHEGMKEIKKIWFVYYKICQKQIDGILLVYKDKLPEKPQVDCVMDNWDFLDISNELLDTAGCIIPDERSQKDVYAGLNA